MKHVVFTFISVVFFSWRLICPGVAQDKTTRWCLPLVVPNPEVLLTETRTMWGEGWIRELETPDAKVLFLQRTFTSGVVTSDASIYISEPNGSYRLILSVPVVSFHISAEIKGTSLLLFSQKDPTGAEAIRERVQIVEVDLSKFASTRK